MLEQRCVALGDPARALAITDPQPPGELAVTTARQGDQPFDVLGQERLGEARRALRAGHVRPADQPAQAPIAGRVAGQEDEVRAAGRGTDPAEVLLDRLPATGQAGPFGLRPGGQAFAWGERQVRSAAARRGRSTRGRPSRGSSRRASCRDDDVTRVRGERIAQLDLHPDHRLEPRLAGRRGKPDDPVEAVVVRHGQAGQAERERLLDELIDRRGAIEKREVRVAMELGVGHGQ